DPRKLARAMVEQCVDERSVEIARRRVDDEPRRLVDDQEMVVLEDDHERNVLWLVMRGLRLGDGDAQLFHAVDLCRRIANRLAFRLDRPASDQRFQSFARKGWDCSGERTVETPAGMGSVQAHVDRLTSPHLQTRYGN